MADSLKYGGLPSQSGDALPDGMQYGYQRRGLDAPDADNDSDTYIYGKGGEMYTTQGDQQAGSTPWGSNFLTEYGAANKAGNAKSNSGLSGWMVNAPVAAALALGTAGIAGGLDSFGAGALAGPEAGAAYGLPGGAVDAFGYGSPGGFSAFTDAAGMGVPAGAAGGFGAAGGPLYIPEGYVPGAPGVGAAPGGGAGSIPNLGPIADPGSIQFGAGLPEAGMAPAPAPAPTGGVQPLSGMPVGSAPPGVETLAGPPGVPEVPPAAPAPAAAPAPGAAPAAPPAGGPAAGAPAPKAPLSLTNPNVTSMASNASSALQKLGILNKTGDSLGPNALPAAGLAFSALGQKKAGTGLEDKLNAAGAPARAASDRLLAEGLGGRPNASTAAAIDKWALDTKEGVKQRYASMGRNPDLDSAARKELADVDSKAVAMRDQAAQGMISQGLQAAQIASGPSTQAALAGAQEDRAFQTAIANMLQQMAFLNAQQAKPTAGQPGTPATV